MDCELLTVGTELLLGFTVDSNAAVAGRALAAAGLRLVRRATVGDDEAAIRDAAAAALDRTGTVILTGGLGPTRDDCTREAIAALFGRALVRDPAVLAAIEERFARLGRGPMPEANRRQADVPHGATVLPNARGTAPGLMLEDGRGRLAVLLPGVPGEMQGLLEEEVVPRLLQRRGAAEPAAILSRTLRTTGISESALADRVGDPARILGEHLTLAWLPGPEGTDLRLTAWGLAEAPARAALERPPRPCGRWWARTATARATPTWRPWCSRSSSAAGRTWRSRSRAPAASWARGSRRCPAARASSWAAWWHTTTR